MKAKFFFIIFLLIIGETVKAQVGAVVGVVGGDFAVKDVLNKFRQDAELLLNQANSDGNALINRMGNEVNVAVGNADILLQKDLNKTVSQLSDQNSRIIIAIAQLNKTAHELANTAYNIKDATILDLRKILGDYLPFNKSYFYVQRIDGITQLYNDQNDYIISIAGIGFGFDSEKFKSKIIGIDQMNAVEYSEVKNASNLSNVTLKKEKINSLISNPSKITQLKLKLIIQVQRQTGVIFHSWETKNFELPITLSIIPNTTPNIQVKYSMPKYDWVTIPDQDPIVYSFSTPNHDQHDQRHDNIRSFTYDDYKSVTQNKRFVNPRLVGATGTGCPWTKLEFIHLEESGTKLHAQFSTWGLPCTYSYGATVQEYKQVGINEDNMQQITGIKYGGNIVVTIPNTCTYWEVNCKSADNNNINIIGPGSYGSLIVFSNIIDDGVNKKIVYNVSYPF